jgi:hypothetical protein
MVKLRIPPYIQAEEFANDYHFPPKVSERAVAMWRADGYRFRGRR